MTRQLGWLASRWIVVPGAIALVTLAWNAYVAAHNHGLVAGIVVDPSGAPVPGATVVLFEQNVTTFTERARRRTDSDGRFAFTDNRTHHAQLLAEQPELGRSERKTLRLWFRGQDTTVAEPLILRR